MKGRRLQVGNSYAAITDSASAVKYVVFEKSRTGYAVVDLSENTISVYDYTKPVTLKRAYAEGTITFSLWNAIIDAGAPALPALKLYDVYPWQIDFFDIKKGDSFRLTYDVAYIDDTTTVRISSIEGAVFTHQGKKFQAIPFQQDSIWEFFDEGGNSLRKAFLKAPLDFIRSILLPLNYLPVPVKPELIDSFMVVQERILFQLDSLRMTRQMLADKGLL